MKVGVVGASGYVGGELLRLLCDHPDAEIAAVTAASNAHTLIGEHHPHLVPLLNTEIQETTVDALARCEVVFLALPHGNSAALAASLGDGVVVIDCGADFRLAEEADWVTYYGGEHAGTWPYGLPEFPGARDKLKGAQRIAVPGCYPTAATLAMWPAFAAGLAEPDVVVIAASGTSGAGRSPKLNLLGSEVMGAMSAYGVGGQHRHTPEIRQNLSSVAGQRVTVSFTPMLAPMSRGILATATASATANATTADVRRAYEDAYDTEAFVTLLPESQWPTTAAVAGSNSAHVQVAFDTGANRIVSVCAIDNLTKGTAGAAVQSMNLALGLPEGLGLTTIGVAP